MQNNQPPLQVNNTKHKHPKTIQKHTNTNETTPKLITEKSQIHVTQQTYTQNIKQQKNRLQSQQSSKINTSKTQVTNQATNQQTYNPRKLYYTNPSRNHQTKV